MKLVVTLIVFTLGVMLLASGCAPSAISSDTALDTEGDLAGFWKGLWHGFIVLFTFVVSLFNDKVGVYETHNTGNLYNLGFVLGVMIFFGGSGGGACKRGK